ncbi:2OG-Fe(II) oxygenase family protein [Asticcacaulis sp. ZE23SCel15]|uniref:2OG-Fe(II) oxygenase n=1 Tax=Asticcacaulis sp. ZE23SCel15 TaxID=3059027 RepID=UPI00265F8C65|nr:2OG-Fe(II) oxygenase family protein [Asticcacaulis sp. ZE23SCel15]WKL56867.1 2OG-Fe(II) oxygenase family protein [Asticcacaulis sp. ZE23SCel15]
MLRSDIDVKSLHTLFKAYDRLHIPDILRPDALTSLVEEIETGIPWRLSLNSGPKGLDLSLDELAQLDDELLKRIDDAVYAQAATGFQYRFDAYRLSDEIEAGRATLPHLMALYAFLNSDRFLKFIADVTGDARGDYCDAQVTRYRPGHFLTTHTDAHEEKHRLFAYVLNLSGDWRSDWGGLLQFIAPDGHISEAYTPVMNALNLFKVPQAHAVSFVAPFAAKNRLSVTGWVRMKPDART